jgi:hypothetical protein
VLLVKSPYAFIVMPGGFGTLDELTEALTLIQTRKILEFPIVLMGRDYWAPFIAMVKTMVEAGTISASDLDLMLVTDSVPDAMAHIELHAVRHFGLKRRKIPRSRKIFWRALASKIVSTFARLIARELRWTHRSALRARRWAPVCM